MLHAIRWRTSALAVLAGMALAAPSADANSGNTSNVIPVAYSAHDRAVLNAAGRQGFAVTGHPGGPSLNRGRPHGDLAALAAPSVAANVQEARDVTIRIVTTEFVPANGFTGDVILVGRGGPFGAAKPGHGTEHITDVRPTSNPNTYLYVGHDVYHTSFGSIRLHWRATCSPVNAAQTKWFCGDGTWHVTAAGGAYAGMVGGGTFTNVSYNDSTGASFAHSYIDGTLGTR